MELFQKHRRKIILAVIFAVVVYAALLFVSDTQKLLAAIREFRWEFLPAIVGLTLFNYAVRFLKWHWYLGVVGVKNLAWVDSLLIFIAGFSMTLTPGKAGEFLKAFLVKQRAGAPVATVSPIILAERLTDGLALLILASFGLLLFESAQVRIVLLGVIVMAALLVAFVQRRALANRVMSWMQRAPLLATRMHHIHAFYASAYELFKFKTLAIAIALGLISWAGECVALALIVVALGIPFSWPLVALSAFAMGFATLAGSVLLVPGGLGVAEASIGGLLFTFGRAPWLAEGTITEAIAAVATLMIRFATLWFGFLLGLVCLLVVQKRFRSNHSQPQDQDQEPRICVTDNVTTNLRE